MMMSNVNGSMDDTLWESDPAKIQYPSRHPSFGYIDISVWQHAIKTHPGSNLWNGNLSV